MDCYILIAVVKSLNCLDNKVAEQHVLEDLGFIPSLSDGFKEMPAKPWMVGQRTEPVEIVD